MPANPNTDHYTWADITSKPETATRWPAWGEVTGKPSSFTPSSHTHSYAGSASAGGSATTADKVIHSAGGVSYISGAAGNNAAVWAKKATGSVWYPAVSLQTSGGGAWQIGNYNDETLEFQYATAANISSQTNTTSEIYMRAGDTGYVLTSGNYGSHTHSYLPLSGGTLTGALSGTSITASGTIKSTYAGPAFLAQTATGSWSYLRLHNGSNYWDIATKSDDNSGCLDFRPGGSANKGPRIYTSGMMVFADIADNASYANAAVQIREQGYGGSGSDTWGRAPRLAWHWSGRVAAQIGLASNGYLYTAPVTGTTFYKLMYESGTWGINITGSAGSVAWGNVTGKPSTFTPASHTHDYLPIQNGRAVYIYTNTAGVGFQPGSGSALEIREVNLVAAGQSAWTYAPKIGFHWGNRIARQFGINSSGEFCFFNQSSDSSYATIRCGNIYGSLYGRIYCSASVNNIGSSWVGARDTSLVNADYSDATSSVAYTLCRLKYSSVTYAISGERSGQTFGIYGWANSRTENGVDWQFYIASDRYFHCNTRIYNAVWNDFAEYRQGETTEGGRVVCDDNTGIMKITTQRMQPAARIISDTYGFAVGESDNCKTPIGVGGRVLVYPYQDRNNYKVGDSLCAAPGGTVDIMTREEIMLYPDRIIGIVSEIPNYETWENKLSGDGAANTSIEVKGRIWAYVK